jgi:diguanylate cyclase (GGDEF)-like protein
LRNTSLAFQLTFVALLCLVGTSAAALLLIERRTAGLTPEPHAAAVLRLQLVAALSLIAAGSLVVILGVARRLLRPVDQIRDAMAEVISGDLSPKPLGDMPNRDMARLGDTFGRLLERLKAMQTSHQRAQSVLAARTHQVDRLLEFSQTIQGAGQSDQVYSALAHYLHRELGLAGVAIVTHEAMALPAMQLRVARPESIVNSAFPVAEMDPALCPCLRQNMAKHFRPDGSPIRCVVERSLTLGPEYPAYCIPFHVGRGLQGTVHMALPPQSSWDDARKRLAETYVNAAVSSLISLHLVEEAEKQSLTDSLTGLYNRHSMERLLQREVALAERHNHAMSVVMIDVDHFKQINDAHGHAAGDHMLKAFADCVRMTLRKTDLAFRYGGDEFVIALPQTPLAQAQQVVQKLRMAFAAVDFSHAITHLDRQPTMSIGVAERSKANNVLTLASLLTAADEALYEAKTSTRNCVRVYRPNKAA